MFAPKEPRYRSTTDFGGGGIVGTNPEMGIGCLRSHARARSLPAAEGVNPAGDMIGAGGGVGQGGV